MVCKITPEVFLKQFHRYLQELHWVQVVLEVPLGPMRRERERDKSKFRWCYIYQTVETQTADLARKEKDKSKFRWSYI